MADCVELLYLPASPFSLKARWALDASGIQYRSTQYTPVLGEASLRKKLNKKTGKVTVPVLFAPEGALTDSFDIAKWADDQSKVPGAGKLFPAGKLDDIRRFNAKADDLMAYTRVLLNEKFNADPKIMRSVLPGPMKYLGPLSTWLASYFVSKMSAKYEDVRSNASLEKAKAALQDVRDAVSANNGYLLGTFTYADITLAVSVLSSTEPLGPPYSPAPLEFRKALTNEALKTEYADVVAWAKKIVEDHFPAATKV